MGIQDMRAQYTVPIDNTLEQTISGVFNHPEYGKCLCTIYRAVRNDNGIARDATIRQLKKGGPNVEFWDGDVIQYYDMHGELVEEVA